MKDVRGVGLERMEGGHNAQPLALDGRYRHERRRKRRRRMRGRRAAQAAGWAAPVWSVIVASLGADGSRDERDGYDDLRLHQGADEDQEPRHSVPLTIRDKRGRSRAGGLLADEFDALAKAEHEAAKEMKK